MRLHLSNYQIWIQLHAQGQLDLVHFIFTAVQADRFRGWSQSAGANVSFEVHNASATGHLPPAVPNMKILKASYKWGSNHCIPCGIQFRFVVKLFNRGLCMVEHERAAKSGSSAASKPC